MIEVKIAWGTILVIGYTMEVKPPAMITWIKLIHSAIWAVMAAAVFVILYSGITGNINWLTYAAIGLIVVEIVVLSLNDGACPLTTTAKRVKPDWKDGDDIFLPTWLAVRNKMIFGTLFVLGVLMVAFRLILIS